MGDRVEIELPPLAEAGEVVATFVAQPGWKAFVDGRPAAIRQGEDCFIRVRVEPTGRPQMLVLDYEPYSNGYLWGCLAISLGLAVLISRKAATMVCVN